MKMGLFTDSHYSSAEMTCGNRYNSKSLYKIKKAFEYFQNEKCDLVVCLGDLIDKEDDHKKEVKNLKEIRDVMNEFDIRTFVIMGNHDGFAFEKSEFYQILGEKFTPAFLSVKDKNLVFIDTCYFKNGDHYKPGDTDWTDTYFPYIEELKKQLSGISGSTFIFMHQNIDPNIPEDHRVFNDSEIRDVLEKSNKVKSVFQGHFHPGNNSEHNGIKYVTIPAMCESEEGYMVIEI